MLDFTSALYLGLRHPSPCLRPWSSLTTGKPAALAPPAGAAGLARQLAALQGCQRGTLLPSTLHLFWDLFAMLARDTVRIYLDAGTYAMARWGVDRARARGIPVRRLPFHDPVSLELALCRDGAADGRRPVVVADGLSPGLGGPAPLQRYLACLAPHRGLLVIDDTQALGILGERPSAATPYGSGGGGSLRFQGVGGPNVIIGSSLAKGFGVPIAALCGSEAAIERFEQMSETRVHGSPPSAAVIHAAEHALAIGRRWGDALRLRLARLVQHFRRGLAAIGLRATGGLFPVQSLALAPGIDAGHLHQGLLNQGIRTVLHRQRASRRSSLSFLFTTLHEKNDIDRAVAALASVLPGRIAALEGRR